MRRKPGEPIYLRHHMLALALAVVGPVALPQLYHMLVGPISFGVRFLAGLGIAILAGILLSRLYAASAKNEPLSHDDSGANQRR